jgi:hypothetical protein
MPNDHYHHRRHRHHRAENNTKGHRKSWKVRKYASPRGKEIHQSHNQKHIFIFQKVIVLSFLSLTLSQKNCNTKKGLSSSQSAPFDSSCKKALGKGFGGYTTVGTHTQEDRRREFSPLATLPPSIEEIELIQENKNKVARRINLIQADGVIFPENAVVMVSSSHRSMSGKGCVLAFLADLR